MPAMPTQLDIGPQLALAALLFGGMLMCFFGSRIFVVALALGGFICGASIGAYVAWRVTAPADIIHNAATYAQILDAMYHATNRTVILVWTLAGGVGGALICILMHWVGVFILGVWMAAALVNLVMSHAPLNVYLIALAVAGLIGGIAAIVMRRQIIIISTAYNGALALMFAIYATFTDNTVQSGITALRNFNRHTFIFLVCTLLFGTIGSYVQFALGPKTIGAPSAKPKAGG